MRVRSDALVWRRSASSPERTGPRRSRFPSRRAHAPRRRSATVSASRERERKAPRHPPLRRGAGAYRAGRRHNTRRDGRRNAGDARGARVRDRIRCRGCPFVAGAGVGFEGGTRLKLVSRSDGRRSLSSRQRPPRGRVRSERRTAFSPGARHGACPETAWCPCRSLDLGRIDLRENIEARRSLVVRSLARFPRCLRCSATIRMRSQRQTG